MSITLEISCDEEIFDYNWGNTHTAIPQKLTKCAGELAEAKLSGSTVCTARFTGFALSDWGCMCEGVSAIRVDKSRGGVPLFCAGLWSVSKQFSGILIFSCCAARIGLMHTVLLTENLLAPKFAVNPHWYWHSHHCKDSACSKENQ